MHRNMKFQKIGAYLGILAIFSSNVAVAMQPAARILDIHARKQVTAVEHPPIVSVVSDISSVRFEDFDVTASLTKMIMPHTFEEDRARVHELHLDDHIPYIGGGGAIPRIDYASLKAVPFFIAKFLGSKIYPSKRAGALQFFENIVVKNQQSLRADTTEIPDLDCLYYGVVKGSQHLFLRLSSSTRQEAELFYKKSSGKTFYADKGDILLRSDGSLTLDHIDAEADNITVEAKDTIFTRASKMKSKWVLRFSAGKQRHETVINKWVREESGKHHFIHEEGIDSVDDDHFIAKVIIQEGDKVENIGILVEAERFEDLAKHTSNMPAKTTLHNYAWEEDVGTFSSAETTVIRTDDVLVPTRYHVNYYKSVSPESGSSVKFGYTLINAGSKIEVLKDVKEDVVVDEQHTIEIHEEKSGFSVCGGAKVPDPTALLQRLHKASSSGNMIGLSVSAISAVAKGIQAATDYETMGKLINKQTPWDRYDATALLQTLSHYINGPSIQFGSRSVDIRQQTTQSHGNTFLAPQHVYHTPTSASFAGTYIGKEIDIKSGTMITFDLPQTVDSEMSLHQSGISMDLLSFAIALINPQIAGVVQAGLAASSISVSFQENKSHQVTHVPTVIQADKLSIEAENGQLTQAQIKAGIIHAIFTNDLVLKTLANEKWTRKKGGGFSFSLGAFVTPIPKEDLGTGSHLLTKTKQVAGFTQLSDALIDAASYASISSINAGSFEKIIDDFASMVGEEEFYLRVGGILRTESAFVGHKTHDSAHEHIEAKERQDVKVEEHHESYDHSFDLSVGDLMTVISSLKKQFKDEAIADGLTQEEAELKAEKETAKINQDIVQEQKNVDETADKIVKIDEKVKTKAKSTNKEKSEALIDGLKALAKEQAELQSKTAENIVEEASIQTQLDALNSAKQKYLTDLAKIEKEEKVRHADEVVNSHKTLIWTQLDDPTLVDVRDIKLSNETEIRHAAEEKTAREFKRQRDIIEAEYIAQVRFANGEGFSKSAPITAPMVGVPVSIEQINSPKNRLERLRQQELSKIGEDDVQRFTRFIPVVGPAIDYSYDRISGTEFIGSLGIDAASTLALGGMQKAVTGSKAALQAQFQRNLYAKFNQAPYNPRTSQNLASRLLVADEFTRTTVPGQSMPNVRLAGQCKERIVGTDPFTFEPIIQRIVFDQRGFPIFDPYIKVETRISSPNLNLLSRKKHFQMATQNLYQDILSGKIDRNLFSQSEWLDIEHGRPKIGNYTWHHHQETGRMQLVPTDIHQWIGHIGGFEIWK